MLNLNNIFRISFLVFVISILFSLSVSVALGQDKNTKEETLKQLEEAIKAGKLFVYLNFGDNKAAAQEIKISKVQKRDPDPGDPQEKKFSCYDLYSIDEGIESAFVGNLHINNDGSLQYSGKPQRLQEFKTEIKKLKLPVYASLTGGVGCALDKNSIIIIIKP